MSSSNNSVPDRRPSSAPAERRPSILPLPARQPNMTRKQEQRLFEQVKVQVLDTATKYFDQTLMIIKNWMKEESK